MFFFFFLELRRKTKTNSISTFILQYSSKVFFFFYLNQKIIMDMCMQFIIVAFYDKFITNEVT